MRRTLLALGLAACGAESGHGANFVDSGFPGDGASSGDANPCGLSIMFDPPMPVADSLATIRATAIVSNGTGVLTYAWDVLFQHVTPVNYTYAAADQSQIDFIAPTAGLYDVRLAIMPDNGCAPYSTTLDVAAPGANVADYRVRITPPSALAPPQETTLQVLGGGDVHRNFTLDPGLPAALSVKNGSTGVPAYVRFAPVSAPDAIVEGFAAASGTLSLRVLPQMHDVIVVPAVPGLAPVHLTWSPGSSTLAVGPGTTVTGNVKDPSGAALAGAKVQLATGGVPSSLATTDASGNFTLHASFAGASAITATITPPAGRGLPRLTATSAFNLNQAMQVNYSATLATCDLGGTPVQRASTAQPGVDVALVASLPGSAGTIAGVTATGSVLITATADGTGRLPSTLVPRAALTAVSQLAATDVGQAALDTSGGCAALTIAMPAPVNASGVVKDSTMTALRGVQIEATPAGVLALAGLPPIQTSSTSAGAFTLPLAAGGRYDVRFLDPSQIAGRLELPNITPGGVPTTAVLPKAVHVSGDVSISGNVNPVIGSSVQVLCTACSGLTAARPVGAGATDTTSHYSVAVPDPGTM